MNTVYTESAPKNEDTFRMTLGDTRYVGSYQSLWQVFSSDPYTYDDEFDVWIEAI